VVSSYYNDNPASGRVLEKLGFEPAGTDLVHCVSRNATVVCNRVWLAREDYRQAA
jgi:RimJ/RimL family protein N-acetyltransferase